MILNFKGVAREGGLDGSGEPPFSVSEYKIKNLTTLSVLEFFSN